MLVLRPKVTLLKSTTKFTSSKFLPWYKFLTSVITSLTNSLVFTHSSLHRFLIVNFVNFPDFLLYLSEDLGSVWTSLSSPQWVVLDTNVSLSRLVILTTPSFIGEWGVEDDYHWSPLELFVPLRRSSRDSPHLSQFFSRFSLTFTFYESCLVLGLPVPPRDRTRTRPQILTQVLHLVFRTLTVH